MHVKYLMGDGKPSPYGVALGRCTKTGNFARVDDKNVLKMYQKA